MSTQSIRSAIFIHSSFRTSSTWIWSKFRANPTIVAYYEYFHERLCSISVNDVEALRPSAWASGHPDVEPYFTEYLPLLRRQGGVSGYQERMAVGQFFPVGGYRGRLSKAEVAYIGLLIANAGRLKRTPFFCCKRSLGRVRALKQGIGGVHFVLRRKLLHQWQSYFRQAEGGNSYFFEMILRVIAVNGHEPYMAILGKFIRERTGYKNGLQFDQLDQDDLFIVFVAFHFYLYVVTLADADLVINTSELVNDQYRRAVEYSVTELTGLGIDLSDARAPSDCPGSLPRNDERMRMEVARLCMRGLEEADKSILQAQSCWQLVDELWADLTLSSNGLR